MATAFPNADAETRYVPHAATECVNTSANEDEGSVISGAGGDAYYHTLAEACAQPGVEAVSAVSFSRRHDAFSDYFSRLEGVYSVATEAWHTVSDETRHEDTRAAFAAVGIVHTSSVTNAGANTAAVLLLDMECPDVSWHSVGLLYRRLCAQGAANAKQQDVWARYLHVAIANCDWSLAHRMHKLSKRHFPDVLQVVLQDSSRAAKRIMHRKLSVANAWKALRQPLIARITV